MRTAYLDLFAGISGDMFLGAMLDAGLDPAVLHDAAAAMKLGTTLSIGKVDRSGITSTKVDVIVNGNIADERTIGEPHIHTHPDEHTHADGTTHTHAATTSDHFQDQRPAAEDDHQHQPKTQHLHKTGQPHTHEAAHEHTHEHSHGRSLTVIRELITASSLRAQVKQTAIRSFERLGHSEAKIHNVPVDQIHFHEVGAVDAIVDIVCAAAGLHALHVGRWVASNINVGGGMVDCAHGRFPVPAPATADLLRGMPTYSADIQKELVTPTGAAILRTLVEDHGLSFAAQPTMRVTEIGYGAGTRNPANFPNVLRISIGEQSATTTSTNVETVSVLETALDDLSPQLLAHVTELVLAQGALDVMLTPVIMKKGRPGTLLTVLCDPADSTRFEQLLLRETSTLGVRIRQDKRSCLERSHVAVSTQYGEVRIKLGTLGGETLNATPEFSDCKQAAETSGAPIKLVQQAAIAAYRTSLAAE